MDVGFHEICHISVNTSPTDLRQVSKFSLVQYLKLFLRHPKDLVSRKNVLGEEKMFFFISLYIGYGLKKWVSEKMALLSDYESFKPGTGVKIFLGSIPKTFSLTPK